MSVIESTPAETGSVPEALEAPRRRRPTEGLAWGYNNGGGLGTGTVARALVPVPVELPERTKDVQGGTDFTVVLTSTGRVYTWGGNRYGQLGDGSNRTRLAPHRVKLPGLARVHAISVGADHVLALTDTGAVYSWGRNTHGQLGDHSFTNRNTPVRVRVPSVARISTGVASSQAVTRTGDLLSWGRPIGHGTAGAAAAAERAKPNNLALPHGARVARVDAGERHLVVLTRDGHLYSFGVNPAGKDWTRQLHTHHSWGRVTSISSGDHHVVALTSSHKVLTWGANYFGQLGNDDTKNTDDPVVVHFPHLRGHVVEVVAGGNSVLVRTSKHEAYVWGQGQFGQNANGKTADVGKPHRVEVHKSRVAAVRAGRYHHLVLLGRHR